MQDHNWAEIAKRFNPLYSALIYDTLEEFGYPDQAISSSIKPIEKSMKVAGPAFTVRGSNSPKREKQETGLEMIESLWPGCVCVMDTGNDYVAAHWGEITSTAARGQGCVGTVVDGGIRDSGYVIAMGYPAFARYQTPVEAYGRFEIIEWEKQINFAGATSTRVAINPGDYVFGDLDGIVIIPADLTLKVLETAEKRFETERKVREDLKAGGAPLEVFRKYGVF
ncbi:RraA family protein [bacterium]|nr:RraA family protein [bacterium]